MQLSLVLVRVDFVCLTAAFNAWMQQRFVPIPKEQIATDGKSIKASLSDYDFSYQDFVSVVSGFSVACPRSAVRKTQWLV